MTEPGPVLRLLGSLANTILDLGLPAVRQWLRDRVGPAADVAQITTDGSFVHLADVVVPLGEAGEVVLERARLTVLPEVRLHAFEGLVRLRFRDLVARLSFESAGDDGEAGAWAAGLLVVNSVEGRTPWTLRARVVAAAHDWRVDDAVFEGALGELRAAGAGTFEPDGKLDAAARGSVRAAAALAAVGAPREAWPRDDDKVSVEAIVTGSPAAPSVKGTLAAPELGFRLGGARFVPAVVVRDVTGEVTFAAGRLTAKLATAAADRRVALDLEAESATTLRGTLRAVVGAALVRELLCTRGVRTEVPSDLAGEVDVVLHPGSPRPHPSGVVSLRAGATRLTLERKLGEPALLRGVVAATDALATGLFHGSVRPRAGEVALELSVTRGEGGLAAEGTASSVELELELARREARIVAHNASARVLLDRDRFAYDELRFEAHGGRFVGEGRIPFRANAASTASPLFLRLEEGRVEVLDKVLEIFAPRAQAAVVLPSTLRVKGTLDLPARGALAVDVSAETDAGTTLGLTVLSNGGALDGTRVRGAIAAADIAATGVTRGLLASGGVVVVDLAARGSSARRDAVLMGWVSATRFAVELGLGARVAFSDLTARVRLDRDGIAWNRGEAVVAGGRLVSAATVAWAGSALAEVSLVGAATGDVEVLAPFVRGKLGATLHASYERGRRLRASGKARLEDAALPALELVKPTLSKYGLRPPSEVTTAPVTARLASTEWGVRVTDLAVDLHGASLRGDAGFGWDGQLDGAGTITLDEEYLRTSKLLTLPLALAERLVVPVRLDGTRGAPALHADLGGSLGRFLKDNRVSQFVTSAVEEAQILLGAHPISVPPKPEPEKSPPVDVAPEVVPALEAALAAHAADWADIEARMRG